MLWRTKLMTGLLGKIHPDGSQSTSVEYQGQFALLVCEKEHRTCCLIYKASSRCGYCMGYLRNYLYRNNQCNILHEIILSLRDAESNVLANTIFIKDIA